MARDPLSVAPVVLPDSKIPGAVQGLMNQRIGIEQQRIALDAQKATRLRELASVEAIGWERDQRMIDQAKITHQSSVDEIMYNSKGIPGPGEQRQIQRSADAIKRTAAKSVEDKEMFNDSVKWIATHAKDLDETSAMEALELHYAQPVDKRGTFDVTPFIDPEEIDSLFETMKGMGIGVAVDQQRGTKTDIRTNTINEEGFIDSAVKMIQSDPKSQKAYQQMLADGTVSDEYAAAQMIFDHKEAQLDLTTWYKKVKQSTTGTNFKWRTNVPLPDGSSIDGITVKPSAPPILLANPDGEGNVEFKARVIGVKDGQKVAFGSYDVNQKNTVSSDEYWNVMTDEQRKFFVEDFSGGGYTELSTNKKRTVTTYVPLGEIGDWVDNNTPGIMSAFDAGSSTNDPARTTLSNRIKGK